MAVTINGTTNVITPTSAVQPTGSILQVVYSQKKDSSSGSSETAYTGFSLSASITPAATSSKILVIAQVCAGVTLQRWMGFRLYRGGSCVTDAISTANTNTSYAQIDGHYINNNWFAMPYQSNTAQYGNETASVGNSYLDSPSTTSATTYEVKAISRDSDTTWYINRSPSGTSDNHQQGMTSSLTLMEVAG